MPYPLLWVPFERTASVVRRKLLKFLPPGINSENNLLLSSSKSIEPLPILMENSPGLLVRSHPALLFVRVSLNKGFPLGIDVGAEVAGTWIVEVELCLCMYRYPPILPPTTTSRITTTMIMKPILGLRLYSSGCCAKPFDG